MPYILYINGNVIEISDQKPIAQTRQVNDLARLDSRNSSVTNKFIARQTPNNVRAFEKVYLVGNQSNLPYQKNEASLYDSESGACLIYKGWANVVQTTRKGYEITITDGIIDFYRKIENRTLTDVGISALNHSKNLINIVDSWNNTKPYIYAIADYNGKNEFTTASGQYIPINTDFQVPSARVSFLWNKIFEFAGFTYSGSYFLSQDFLNWFVSYPKPVPTLVPIVQLVTQQQSEIVCIFQQQPDFSYIYLCNVNQFPNYAPIQNLPTGSYRIKIEGLLYSSYNGSPAVAAPTFIYSISGNNGTLNSELGESVIVNYNAGDWFYILPPFYASSGSVVTTVERVLGYDANFEDAFLEFSITDFVKEVITHGALTPFKDKYKNHIEYKTMEEILNNPNVIDWSSKFQYKDFEKYRLGNYAKRNNFKYRYNTDQENHNNGFITIDDQNLQEQVDLFSSKIYSPERDMVTLVGQMSNVFKIWEKELQDDSTIKYKDLTGRFYFLRIQDIQVGTNIASKTLNQQMSVSSFKMASYFGMSFQQIINNRYATIKSILDKAKVIDGYFFLTPLDVERFTFENLIYVEQLGSYYLVNKINSFVKGKVTKCELIEVDYKKTITIIGPPQNTATYITINSFTVNGCVLTINYSTDATIGSTVSLYAEFFVVFGNGTELIQNFVVSGIQNVATFTFESGGPFNLRFIVDNIVPQVASNYINFDNTLTCVLVQPMSLVITAVTLISSDALNLVYKIDFTTDAVLPKNVYAQNYKTPVSGGGGFQFGGWSGYQLISTPTTPSINYNASTIFGNPQKIQIKIGTFESNEFIL